MRMHIHISVDSVEANIAFYSALFNQQPSVIKPDYAKWMLKDPKVNFAISNRGKKTGLDHLGFQADDEAELGEIKQRLDKAGSPLLEQTGTTCCYARSDKYWTTDPQGIAWESFHTLEGIPTFANSEDEKAMSQSDNCCTPDFNQDSCCAPAPAKSDSSCCAPKAKPAQSSCCTPSGKSSCC